MAQTEIPAEVEPDDPHIMASWPTGRLLSTAARLVEHEWLAELDRLGLSYAGLIVLYQLRQGPASQTELARGARVENQTMSRTLARLERQEFIVRQRDARDRRRHVVSRTARGSEVAEQARTIEREMFPDVHDVAGLRQGLLEVIASAERARWVHVPAD